MRQRWCNIAGADGGATTAFIPGSHAAFDPPPYRRRPTLRLDGRAVAESLRAAASAPARRRTASEPSKASGFPVEVCEADLAGGIRSASIAGRALPIPRESANRIVVIGDSGCRLKGVDLQDCSDTDAAWPFGRVAAAAARPGPTW